MRAFAMVALLLALSACGDRFPQMSKSGASDAERSRDDYDCRKEGYAAGGSAGGADGVNYRVAADMYRRCMMNRGYR